MLKTGFFEGGEMKYQQLTDFVARQGNISIVDASGKSRTVADRGPDIGELMENATGYLWDGADAHTEKTRLGTSGSTTLERKLGSRRAQPRRRQGHGRCV